MSGAEAMDLARPVLDWWMRASAVQQTGIGFAAGIVSGMGSMRLARILARRTRAWSHPHEVGGALHMGIATLAAWAVLMLADTPIGRATSGMALLALTWGFAGVAVEGALRHARLTRLLQRLRPSQGQP